MMVAWSLRGGAFMVDEMSPDERKRVADRYLFALIERGVPWPLAREAAWSTVLDHDQTHTLDDREGP